MTRPPGRFLVPLALALLLPFAAPRSAHGQTYWFEEYEKAVRLVDQARLDEAAAILEQLIERHPVPLSGHRVYGDIYMNYFPYYQRARIQLARGDVQGASHSLDICEAFGAIGRTQRGARMVQTLRRQIANLEARTAAASSSGTSSD